jgi:hypothetical protein
VKSVLKLLAVSLLGLFGDATYLWRIALCLAAGAGATVLGYLLWPGVLPIWPGVLTMLAAVALGLLWEWGASNSEGRTLK